MINPVYAKTYKEQVVHMQETIKGISISLVIYTLT